MKRAYALSPMNLPLGKRTCARGPVCRYWLHIVVGGVDAQLAGLVPAGSAAAPVAGPPAARTGSAIIGLSAYCGLRCAAAAAASCSTCCWLTVSPEERSGCTSADKPRHRCRRDEAPWPRQAGNQVNHHRDGGRADDDDEQCLDHAIICLQETNHGWTLAFNSLRAGPGNRNRICAGPASPADAQFSLDATLLIIEDRH